MRTSSKPAPEDPPGVGPVRMCVVSRERRRTSDLLHLVPLPDGTLAFDRTGKLDGRGAWVTADRATIEGLEARPGPLRRALEREVRVHGLLEAARAANQAHLLDLLSLAARAGRLSSGAEQVDASARSGQLVGLLLASDASPKSVEAARKHAVEVPVWVLSLDREALGLRIGKGPRAVVGVRPGGPAAALVEQLRRMALLR